MFNGFFRAQIWLRDIIHNIKSKFNIKKFLLLVIPPIVLSWPLLPGNVPFPFQQKMNLNINNGQINFSELPKELEIKGQNSPVGSKTVFSAVLKATSGSMQTEVCLNNKNKIFDGGKEIDPNSLLDSEEAGAISFKYRRLDNGLDEGIYLKIGALNDCRNLPAEGIAYKNIIEVRNPLPLKAKAYTQSDNTVLVKLEPYRDFKLMVYQTPGYFGIKWSWVVFGTNFILFLSAWWVILKTLLSMVNYFLNNKEWL